MELIATPNDIELVSTSQFELGVYPFDQFNYLQSLAYPYHNQDNNLIVSAATSAGKTIVAELAIADTISEGKKAIFLSPLKAVTSEKYDDWTSKEHYFFHKNVEIITGDHRLTESRIKKVKQADLILMTSEMLDTRTRYADSPNNSWLKDVGVVVVDEAHLLTTNRGPALEVGLMRFSELNPDAKIILLSATMSNYKDIGRWVEKLNQKETKVIASDWRPVDLHCHSYPSSWEMGDAMKVVKILTCPDDEVAVHLVSDDPREREIAENRMRGGIENTKTLLFVHTKSLGRELEKEFTKLGFKAEFHNADLDKAKRNKLEKKFRGDLDILISTSTLAWGINLPARNVVVVGERRGGSKVDSLDIAQMAGRAGRFGMYERGDVYLLNCDIEKDFNVDSKLYRVLAFHIIAEISNGTFDTIEGAKQWFKRSFLALPMRDGELKFHTLADQFQCLVGWRCIEGDEEKGYKVTPLGKIARDLYLDPEDIYTWQTNFKQIEDSDLWDKSAAVAWAIANNMKMCSMDYVPQQMKPLVGEFKQAFGNHIKISNSTIIAVLFYRLMRENYDTYMHRNLDAITAPYLQLFLRDSGRIFSALQRISALNKWDRESDFEVLKARIVHGVGEELVELVSIPGVGGTIATQLYKAGLRTLADVVDKQDELGEYITRKANVTRILNGLKELENE